MKVILLRDVARLGKKSDVKNVPDGHAINFLIPRGLAMIANVENLKKVNETKDKLANKEQNAMDAFKSALDKVGDTLILYKVPANEQGHLFKGIKAEDIATLLCDHGFSLTSQNVILEAPIKELGEHAISLQVGKAKGLITIEFIKQ